MVLVRGRLPLTLADIVHIRESGVSEPHWECTVVRRASNPRAQTRGTPALTSNLPTEAPSVSCSGPAARQKIPRVVDKVQPLCSRSSLCFLCGPQPVLRLWHRRRRRDSTPRWAGRDGALPLSVPKVRCRHGARACRPRRLRHSNCGESVIRRNVVMCGARERPPEREPRGFVARVVFRTLGRPYLRL
jgi:hypothetical protein